MNKKIRLLFAVVILAISITLLVWGYWPNARESRVQFISSSEMKLPSQP